MRTFYSHASKNVSDRSEIDQMTYADLHHQGAISPQKQLAVKQLQDQRSKKFLSAIWAKQKTMGGNKRPNTATVAK